MGKLNIPRARFQEILDNDVDVLVAKQEKYGDSWRKREGVSAFDNLARKFDRIGNAAEAQGWDIFKALRADPGPEGLIDDIRDLRNYLTLVEEHMISKQVIQGRGDEAWCADIAARHEYDGAVCSTCGLGEPNHGVPWPCEGAKRVVQLKGQLVLPKGFLRAQED